jgi:hypothetical protein
MVAHCKHSYAGGDSQSKAAQDKKLDTLSEK